LIDPILSGSLSLFKEHWLKSLLMVIRLLEFLGSNFSFNLFQAKAASPSGNIALLEPSTKAGQSIFGHKNCSNVVRFHHNGKIELDMKITQQIINKFELFNSLENCDILGLCAC
jgi:hypothetical protein